MPTNHVIKLDEIHKTYHTGEVDVHAVRGVSLHILPGEFVAIMGSSGSGKSTLMNMIGALDRPTGGHYWLDGIDVSTLDRDALAVVRDAMMAHPILINRPLVVTPQGVKLCRPSELVLDILPLPQHGPFAKEDGELLIDANGHRVSTPPQ